MADQEKRTLDLPWGTLLPVIAALAGVIAQHKPLVSSRPATPGEKTVEVTAEQDVDARLWQDPLVAAQKAKESHEADMLAKHEVVRHDLDALIDLLRKRTEKPTSRVLLLAVMLDSGPYMEQSESRLRSRQAVLGGLSQSGFSPLDGEHIGFATAAWPPDKDAIAVADGLLLPWEECRADDNPERVFPRGMSRVFVLWLPAASFDPFPLGRFAALIDRITDVNRNENPAEQTDDKRVDRDKIDIKLIGPISSGGLQNMINEVRNWPLGDTTRDRALDGVSIISARATACDEALFFNPSPWIFDLRHSSSFQFAPAEIESNISFPTPHAPSVRQLIEGGIPKGRLGGLHFVRTIAQDDIVLARLISELKLRRVNVERETFSNGGKGDQIVLLSEWDSTYGRSLAVTFAGLASHRPYRDLVEGKDENWPAWIQRYQYLRGIDGRLPGEQTKGIRSEEKQKNQSPLKPTPAEATEGLDQSDFLRRLARQLKSGDLISQRRGEGRIRAIGLLGSDIYDKLMILRALRPEFPDAVFFTNNFDAHFERRADWSDVRNLVIASPFSGTLPAEWQPNIAPFRDNAQTAMYTGTLVATGKLDEKTAIEFTKHPKVFEIGRRGAWDLSPSWHLKGKVVSPPDGNWFRDWLNTEKVRWHLAAGSLALLAMVGWISMSIVDRTLPGGGSSWDRLKRVLANTAFWLVCGVPIIVFLLAGYSRHGREPLAFFSGIGIWPSEMLRLVALLLAVHFMIKASFALRANEREISHNFSLKPLPSLAGSRWQNFRLGLTRWQKEYPGWLAPDAKFTAEEAWHAYLRRNQFWPRFIRVGALFSIYAAFSFSVFTLFPQPITPARGETAFRFDFWILIPAVIGMVLLSFYVFDALQLNSNFIRMFTRGVTKWAPDVSQRSRREPPLSDEELSRYHDILFVAQRTEAVAPLIWYPLIVLVVMFIARSSFFANWTWPLSLILIFSINAMWAFGSAIFLRRAAEQLRESAISNLELLRASSYALEEKRRTFDELIAEIRGLKKGAFAPLSEQPFIRAILLPGGGLGLFAVGQRLLESF